MGEKQKGRLKFYKDVHHQYKPINLKARVMKTKTEEYNPDVMDEGFI